MLDTVNADLKSFEDLAQSFARKELSPGKEANDRYPFGPFFDTVLAKAHEVGLLAATLPEECGGTGQGMSVLCVILERLSEADASLAGIVFTNTLAQEIMLAAGEKALLADITGKSSQACEALIACPAFINPSEVHVLPEAVKMRDTYVLNGAMEYTVLGGLAARALVPAKVKNRDGYGFFLVDLDDHGVSRSGPVFSLGLHACPAVDLMLLGARGTCVGQESEGPRFFQSASDRMHAAVSAMVCGIMRGSYEEALAYSRERFQGGWEIINWSGLRMLLADMAMQVKAAEVLASGAALAVEQKTPGWELSSRAIALHLNELARSLTSNGIQVLGGNGYMKDYGQEKRFRDAKQIQSFLGTAPLRKLSLVSVTA